METYNNYSDWIETRAHIIIWLQEKLKNHIRCQIQKTPSIFDENWKPNAKKWKICKLQWKAISKNSQNCTGLKLNFCYQWGVLKTKTPKTPKLDTMGAFFRNKCFVFAWLLKDLYWRHVRRKCFVRSLQTKRAIYLMKTPFQLHHNYFKLHNILMSLHVESDSYDRSGVGMYSCKKLSWKTRVFCVLLWRNKFIDTILVNTFSIWWLNYFSVASWRLPKKIYFGPWVLLSQYSRKNYTPPQKNHVFVRWKTSLFFFFSV